MFSSSSLESICTSGASAAADVDRAEGDGPAPPALDGARRPAEAVVEPPPLLAEARHRLRVPTGALAVGVGRRADMGWRGSGSYQVEVSVLRLGEAVGEAIS